MSKFIINKECFCSVDLTNKIDILKIKCKNCNEEADLNIDYGLYSEGSWIRVEIICDNCNKKEIIYDII